MSDKYYWMWREEKKKRQEVEGENTIIKGIGNNSPEMKALQSRVKELDNSLSIALEINDKYQRELKEIIVVKEPGPAIRGNAKGTIDEPSVSGSLLKKVKPKTNSNPIKNKISPPAIENEATSIPKKDNALSPVNKNKTIMKKDIRVALRLSIFPNFSLKSNTMGIEPNISITANNVIVIVIISLNIIPLIFI